MEARYLILDSRDMPVARAVLENSPDADILQIRVLDGGVDAVLEHEVVKLVSQSESAPCLLGRLLHHKGERISMEALQPLDEHVRENLRMPLEFQSFIYPMDNQWAGRRVIVGHDMSCGGLGFFCQEELKQGERVEVVIPVTSQPLLLRTEIIRRRPSNNPMALYASKFIDMIREEETLVREAVFNIQLQNRNS